MSLWTGAWLGAITGVLALAVLQLANTRWMLPFPPFDVFEWMTRILPGALITPGIDAMVWLITALGLGPTSAAAKLAEQLIAGVQFVVVCAVLGAIVAGVGRHALGSSRRRMIVGGLIAGAVLTALEAVAVASLGELSVGGLVWVAIVLLGWGLLLGGLLHAGSTATIRAENPPAARRRFLRIAAAATLTLSAILLGLSALARGGRRRSAVATGSQPTPSDLTGTSGPAASPAPETLAARLAPVHGTRPEITPNDRFYRIDINLRPPSIDPQRWRLTVDGLVEHPLSLSLDEIRQLPAVSQMITLECISNRIGGDLIGTSLWTGVPLRAVLARAGMSDAAKAVHIAAADGFYESVGLDDLNDERTLLVYAMNRAPLTDVHGFPLRIYIPNRHGMKQPKWITSLRVADRDGPGFWPDRGWSQTAIPNTTSVIDTVGMSMMLGQARVLPVGGIAYAGARGITKVEVQVDDGPWNQATLIAPPLGPLTWVLWRYEWPYAPGRHTFRVRAYDGTGTLQPVEERGPHPDGATGIHSLTTNT